MNGMKNIVIPSITCGCYSNEVCRESQERVISCEIRLFECVFKDFRSYNPGGSFFARDTTVRADSTIWSSIVGVCGQGLMIESSSKGSAELYLNHCTIENCSHLIEGDMRAESCGSIVIFGGAKCYCTDCQIFDNKSGGIFVFGSLWLKGSSIFNNFGIFGGIYFQGDNETFILSMISNEFANNRGLLEGFCLHIENKILFDCDDCHFKDCVSTTIYFEEYAKSVRFGCNFFEGSGHAIFFKERLVEIDGGYLCFDGIEKSLEDDIFVENHGIAEIEEKSSFCSENLSGDDDTTSPPSTFPPSISTSLGRL
jgi:hypothetical protein